MEYYAEFIVTPKELAKHAIFSKDVLICKGETALLTGIVVSVECEAVEGALILVREINCNLEPERMIGYVITNEAGRFAFIVKKQTEINYLLEVYEPIISCFD